MRGRWATRCLELQQLDLLVQLRVDGCEDWSREEFASSVNDIAVDELTNRLAPRTSHRATRLCHAPRIEERF